MWMPKPGDRYGLGRGVQIARVLKLAIAMSQRAYTVSELAVKLYECDCSAERIYQCKHRKQVYRNLAVIELSGVPLSQDGSRYSVDAHFMKRFL